MKKANKGITLVALVVTVIILLILAGISIASLTGNGLFEKAKLAKEKQENAQSKEDEILGDYEKYIDNNRASSDEINKLCLALNSIGIITSENENIETIVEKIKNIQNTNIEFISAKFVCDNNIASYTYTATRKGKIVLTLITARGNSGSLAIQFYCKKNNENISANQTINDGYRILSLFVIDVEEGDIIKFCSQSSGWWGDSGYTLCFVE